MFDLRGLIDTVLARSTGIRQTRDLAAEVLVEIPDGDLREALALALPLFIRHRIGMNRNIPSSEAMIDTMMTTDPYRDTKPRKSSHTNSAHSAASKMIREWWLDQVEVHVAGGGYLRLGECTFDDLIFAAHDRREKADQNIQAAVRFETIADAIKEHGVLTVQELPATVRTSLTPLFER